MNPVEIGIGKSFKGLAAYLLHDPDRAATADRVAWTQSFNLDDAAPDRAWHLMAATALSADQLKAAAGIKKGKRAVNTAFHFSLNFNPEDGATEETQRAAVQGALQSLGLENHQALAVAHRDTAHQHVHVMVNLISPETGLSAASKQPDGQPALLSNSQRKLSKWAQGFEREHGLIVTEGRLANANRRAQGEQVDARRKPRNVHEREKAETQDRRRDYMKREFDASARDIAAEGRELHQAHATQWSALKAAYGAQKEAARHWEDKAIPRAIDAAKARNKPRWADMFARQRDEARDFERGEQSVLGRIWHGAAVFKDKAQDGDALGGFLAAFSREARQAIVQRKHDRERARMGQIVRDDLTEAIDGIKAEQKRARDQARAEFLLSCAALRKAQGEERAAMRLQWNDHNAARRAALTVAPTRSPRPDRNRDMQRGRGLEPG